MKTILLLALLALAVIPVSAGESDWVRNTRITNYPSFLAANASTSASQAIYIRPDRSTGIFVSGVGTNNATNSLQIALRGSIDGVYSNSVQLMVLSVPITGTNRMAWWTNLSLGTLPWLHAAPLTNGATGVTNLTVNICIPK